MGSGVYELWNKGRADEWTQKVEFEDKIVAESMFDFATLVDIIRQVDDGDVHEIDLKNRTKKLDTDINDCVDLMV